MGTKSRKSSQGEAEDSSVGNVKNMKRKIPHEETSNSTLAENKVNPGDVDHLIDEKYDFLGTIANEGDSSDNEEEEEEEEEGENYEVSDSDSDVHYNESESEELSFEEGNSNQESDFDISDEESGSEHGENDSLSNPSTSKGNKYQFESFSKLLLKSLQKKESSSKSIEGNSSADELQANFDSNGKITKELLGRKGPTFEEVVREKMKESQKMAGRRIVENDGVLNITKNKGSVSMESEKIKETVPKAKKEIELTAELDENEVDNEETSVRKEIRRKERKGKTKHHDRELVKSDDTKEKKQPNKSLDVLSSQIGLKRDLNADGSFGGGAKDEYENDTSDEEDIRNTVGNIPLKWYDEYDHVGYDWDGKKITKPPSGDELDNFLRKMQDPNFWRTVKDPQTGEDVVLCDTDAEFIKRLQNYKIPDSDFNEYAPWVDWFSSEVMKMPLRKFPEHKRSFIPSKDEAKKVSRLVHAMKMGWIKPKIEKPTEPQFYNLWESDNTAEHMRRIHNHIPAPKRSLPNHAESYNPPAEYLFDKREMKLWKKLKDTPSKRKLHFIPQKFSSLREVPGYERYLEERFFRCLDLYLCPRARKMRLLIEPEDLVPQLPSPKDLQPFPTTQSLVYKGHADMVRTITVDPKGQYIASGSDDMTVKIWEVATGRCVRTIPAGGIVRSVSWCPNVALSLLAVAADKKLLLINPEVGDLLIVKKTDSLLEEHPEQDVLVPDRVKSAVQWEQAVGDDWKKGVRIIINHFKEIKQVTWHGRGDYFATVMSEAQNRSVVIHQVSKRRSQIPFNRSKGLVQCVLFHPIRPIFFVATQKNVRVYDLIKQEIAKKLMSNAKWISTMAIHPAGDNLLVATYDRKILWFDLDLSTKPYQTLRVHSCAVRGVGYHKRYPLFASCSDDSSVIISHGMVYNDLLKNPLIVPLKRLNYHEKHNDFSALDLVFHPSQPWLFSSGADGTVRLYT